ncbi:MAG TPA: OmpA family protein [Bacteroidota bacterium]|nr:OmpA family protein [Bacteroidota bacterium]
MNRLWFFVLMTIVLSIPLVSQTEKWSGGAGIGGIFGATSLIDKQGTSQGRAFVRYGFNDFLLGEIGAGVGDMKSELYSTRLFPIDYRFVLMPVSVGTFAPFAYGGIGALNYSVRYPSPVISGNSNTEGWTGYVPVGVGIQVRLNDGNALEVSGGFNQSFTDNLKGYVSDSKDAFWGFLIGLTVHVGENENGDADHDGLTNKQEAELGTDPHNPDTDGDGLSDGDEVLKYHTDPLKKDSDGDGLSDYDEVMTYHTDPNKMDTDGDGLSDGDEVLKYHTDPLKVDTDGDGLSDGDEVLKYHTDPLKVDTDGDGLSDGDEVLKYHTDPLKKDTDGGGIDDGAEVARGTNPLDPSDDMPKKEELKAEVGKAIVLEGIVFKTGSAEVSSESAAILEKAYNTMNQNPDMMVEIQGHTDNVGKHAANVKLSQKRADAVKAYLVDKGIAATRITTKGFGPDKPIAPNTTKDGRQKNRRIEFLRTK